MPQFKNKNPAPAPEALFTVRESRLCAELKMSKDQLRGRRQAFLLYGHHWDYVDKRVLYSELGAVILRGTRGAPLPEPPPPDAPAVDCEAPRPPVALLLEKNPLPFFAGQLLAWAMPSRNPKLLVCYVPGTDPSNPLNLVSCYVRSNVNFLRGMTLPGPGRTLNQVGQTQFELAGACPRYRGRW